ncbi:MAG: hypothetical protein MHM6MM_002574 [Cercozoa sp. M6MM]
MASSDDDERALDAAIAQVLLLRQSLNDGIALAAGGRGSAAELDHWQHEAQQQVTRLVESIQAATLVEQQIKKREQLLSTTDKDADVSYELPTS